MTSRVLNVRVKPNARAASLRQLEDGSWVAAVPAAPVDGKANAALIELVAQYFDVPKSAVRIRSGAGGRYKRVQVDA